MEPNIWGPAGWTFLHSVTFKYPENPSDLEKQKYYNFFNSLKNVLPCPTCQEHYENNFEKIPIRLENREELIEWLIDLHNEVNRMNGKRVYTYDEVYDIYNDMYGEGEKSKKSPDYLFILLLLAILVIGCYYYKEVYLKKN